MPSWRKIIYFISSPAQEYPPLGMTAVEVVSPSSMLNTRSSPSNQIRLCTIELAVIKYAAKEDGETYNKFFGGIGPLCNSQI